MKAIMVMFDSLNRRYLPPYGCNDINAPNFQRLAERTVTFDNCYIGSMPCMPARRELHTGRYNFLHRSWGPLEPFDDSMPEMLKKSGIYTHIISDHGHYWEDGGATYHTRYNSWEISRGQEGDPWKGQVKEPDMSHVLQTQPEAIRRRLKKLQGSDTKRQDAVNRMYLKKEENMPQAVTFHNGLEFIENNHEEDDWFLQIETFDPHEPFFASERFREMYPDPDYMGVEFDWPPYEPVSQSEEEVQHCRKRYKALLSMCDYYLGSVLDAMDKYQMWDDTLLIVNTDHGFLLGEHEWWGKTLMPYYNEIARIPLFIWDPRIQVKNVHRKSLVQTIDLAPTILEYFGVEPTQDMIGKSLTKVMAEDDPVRKYALFGGHSAHINITDGRYIYMRCPSKEAITYEYTLMPMHMKNMFSVNELQNIELEEPFSFTKGCRVMKIPVISNGFSVSSRFGTKLFDLLEDSSQMKAIENEITEVCLLNALREQMMENDAPAELYARFGLSKKEPFTVEMLREEKQKENQLLTMEGLEGITFEKSAFLQLNTLFGFVPRKQKKALLVEMKQALGVQRSQNVTADFVMEFVSGMPLSANQMEMVVYMMRNIGKVD